MSAGEAWHSHRPGSVLGGAALGFALATVGIVGGRSSLALLATAVGVVGLTLGLSLEKRRFAGLGVLALLGGVLAAGAVGTVSGRLLPATATGLLSWEFAVGSLDRRAELRGGTVEESEARHVLSATAVGALGTALVYVLSRSVGVGVSVLGVTLLLIAAVALGLALRE